MTKAEAGHTAYDAAAGIRDGLAKLPDDEARIRKCRAAIEHAVRQLEIFTQQVEDITEKSADVSEQWRAKLDEAVVIREAAADELDLWENELSQHERHPDDETAAH